MNDWNPQELDQIAATAEIGIAPIRPDGSVRPYTTIWAVPVGDDLFIRSFRGPRGSWFRAAHRTGRGRIRANGAERDVTFHDAGGRVDRPVLDQAYRSKYGPSPYVDAMIADPAALTTLRVAPA